MTINDLRKGRQSIIGQDYFVTFTTWKRQPLCIDHSVAKIIAKTIHYHDHVTILAWVVMPDHVHVLFTLESNTLSNVVCSIKSNSSRQIQAKKIKFKWAVGFYDHALRKEEARIDIARYIVANPLRGGLISNIADYPWWNAIYL